MSSFPKLGFVPNLRGYGGCYCGRRGMPREWVQQMYQDYLRLGSLEKVGKLHGRTRQSMFGIFQTAGLPLNAKAFQKPVSYRGRKYTNDKDGYLRDTVFRGAKYNGETFLHRRVWVDHNGPIPPGNKICFKDGDRQNCAIGNLEMLTHDQQQQRRGTGRNQYTVTAKARLSLLLRGGTAAARLQRKAA